MAAAAVREHISSRPVVVFSKTYCPYCKKAKATLKKYVPADKIRIIELDEVNGGDALQDEMAKVTNSRTVPKVFVKGKLIGGGDDVEALDQNGRLYDILADAGAVKGGSADASQLK